MWKQKSIQANHIHQFSQHGKGKGKAKVRARKGKGKGKGKGKVWNIQANQSSNNDYRSDQSRLYNKNKRKHNGTDRCQAKGCTESAKGYTFCLGCWKQGMDRGHIMCYDDYKQDMSKDNRKHQTGSPDKKLKAAAAFGEEMYKAFKQVNTSQQAPDTINAQQVKFDDEPVQEQNDQQSVFERMHKAYMTNVEKQEETHNQRMESVFQRMGKHFN